MENLGVRAIDDKTLEITLKAPTPYFIEQLTHYTAFPVPKHLVEKYGDDWIKKENIASNGAYVLEALAMSISPARKRFCTAPRSSVG